MYDSREARQRRIDTSDGRRRKKGGPNTTVFGVTVEPPPTINRIPDEINMPPMEEGQSILGWLLSLGTTKSKKK